MTGIVKPYSKIIKGWLLRLATRKRRDPFEVENVKSVLFLRYDKIGDMIISSAVFRELKKTRPEVSICVLASEANAPSIKYNKNVDKVYIYPYGNIFKIINTMLMIRRDGVDCVVEFYHSVIWHAIINILLVRPRYVISTYKDGRYGVGPGDLELYDYFSANKDLNRHLSDIYLETLAPLGVVSDDSHYDFFVGDREREFSRAVYSKAPGCARVVINIQGSRESVSFSNSDIDSIITCIIHKKQNAYVFLMGLPHAQSRLVGIAERYGNGRVFVVPVCEDIVYAGAIVKDADLVVTPDTAIVHIACAFDIPVVAVYVRNKSLFTHFAPRSKNSRVIFCNSSERFEGYDVNEICDKALELL